MRLLDRHADRLQRALEGERITDEELRALVGTANSLGALSTSGLAPREEFVGTLRERLMAEAASLPTPSPAAARAAAAQRAAARSRPVALVVGRGFPRMALGAAASALAVAAIVGVASRGALPGGALYPVKGWLDSIAVQMADSEYDRGLTHLAQAQEHISDARTLAEAERPDADNIAAALGAATDSVTAAQRELSTAFARTGNPQALLALQDFSARALPQVEAMRPDVPADALGTLGELEAALREAGAATARRIALCGAPCSGAVSGAAGSADSASLPSASATTGPVQGTRSIGVTVPGAVVTGQPGGGAATATSPGGGVVIGGESGGATLSSSGANLNLPSVSLTVPGVPGSSASVGQPRVTVGPTGVEATVPGATLGSLTLPGVTASLP